jgi:phospholipase C
MLQTPLSTLRRQLFKSVSAAALAAVCVGTPALAADPDKAADKIDTATPIKRVLVIVGENRSFDDLYATYVPKDRDQKIQTLLSETPMGHRVRTSPRRINSRSRRRRTAEHTSSAQI